MKRIKNRDDLKKLKDKILSEGVSIKALISVCSGTGCNVYNSKELIKKFEEEIKDKGLDKAIKVKKTGCQGFCERGPIVIINPANIFYQRVKKEYVTKIIDAILKNEVVDELLYIDEKTGKRIIKMEDIPFYKKQRRLILGNNGLIDPTEINDYIAIGGYEALVKALEMEPWRIIEEIKKSGLRGRGGGGFPTGEKWENCRKAKGEKKYIICNADEGDPGAYMDRSVLEGNPHSVIEGMIIGAYAICGRSVPCEGYIYVRHEYPLAVKNVEVAIKQARELGFLGKDILSTEFSFDIKVARGGGAFVCGESTALMASLEGKVGEPRAKYIHTVEKGLWGKPSNLNNVETWANVPLIIKKGAEWYSQIGTEKSKGTKIFSLVGKIKNTGLVEVPMGISLREIIHEIGGGIPDDKKFKGVQTGGPSGGIVPERFIDLPVDFDELTKVGSMMGSGGMIVMDEDNCVVDIAKYFLSFLKEESCGKCTHCSEGIERMLEILEDICEGRGNENSIALLEELAIVVKETSLCGLGQTAPNPTLTTLKYFKDEYISHIKDKKCPARVCKSLIRYKIIESCIGCGACKKLCPQNAISGEKKQIHLIDETKCIKCGICVSSCKHESIIVM